MLPKPTSCKGYLDAYCAGLLDGEGSISIAARPSGAGASVCVSVNNTNLSLLKPFKKYGGTISNRGPRGLGKKDCYVWVAYSHNAKRAILKMAPHLRRLRKRAKAGLTIIEATGGVGEHLTPYRRDLIARAKRAFTTKTC